MPIYVYKCAKQHTLEVLQKIEEAGPSKCPTCQEPLERVYTSIAIHFKGSGFYNTDYGKAKKLNQTKAKTENEN